MLRKFYVVVDNPADKQSVQADLESDYSDEAVPARSVDITNNMPFSEHNSVAILTDEEALALMSDLRIREVHLDPKELGVKKRTTGIRPGTYSKNIAPNSNHKNWGLVRSNSRVSNFPSGYSTTTTSFTFNLDGTGVDIIIIDTGVEPNHPEFAVNADGTGGSRVVDYDWTQHGIITEVPEGGFLGDCDGHGSNCASIAAGNTQGWAPGARIYSLRSVGTGGVFEYDITDERILGLLDDFEVWQTIRAFHQAKTPDPITGYKRPTIVNCSFGYIKEYTEDMESIRYRGVTYPTEVPIAAYGTIGTAQGGPGRHGYFYPALNAEIESCITAGVIVVAAAGNDRHKIDVSSGLDYNNYWTEFPGFAYYYHRGMTPAGTDGVICVGSIAAFATASVNPEHKTNFSCTGPGVDIWAPGDFIMGAYANSPYAYPAVQDPRNSNYYLNAISGTSQACPQVVGVLSCVLQARPWMTQQQCLNWTTSTASTWAVNESYFGGNGYVNFGSLQGAAKLALYQPFNLSDPLTIRG
jgi:subtilisin family serine protease